MANLKAGTSIDGYLALHTDNVQNVSINGPLTIVNDIDSAGGGTKGIIIKNTGSGGEAAVAYNNSVTGSNYWFTGLNESGSLQWTYGSAFSGYNMFLTSAGVLTTAAGITANGTINAAGGSSSVSNIISAGTSPYNVLSYSGGAQSIIKRLDVGGATQIGGDEGLYLCSGEAGTSAVANTTVASEVVHICSDDVIYMYSNLQNGWASRSTASLSTAGVFTAPSFSGANVTSGSNPGHTHSNYLTSNQTITLSGDVTGSGTTAITTVVGDDSHNHTGSTISSLATGDVTSGTFSVARGGTGLATITANRILTGNGTSAMTQESGLTYGSSVLYVSGAIHATGDITAYYSDIRLKTDIEPITNALDKLNSLTGFTYNANDLAKELIPNTDITRKVGVSAQSVKAILPEAVKPAPFDSINEEGEVVESISGEDYLTVQYEKLVPLLIESVKELSNKVNLLEKELADIKK